MAAEPKSFPRPRLVLRVAFAGNRRLIGDFAAQRDRLKEVMTVMARRVAEIAPGMPERADDPEPQVRDYFCNTSPPLMRLVTGLCEGGDLMAGDALISLRDAHSPATSCEFELAAVIPFALDVYRSNQSTDALASFDNQAQQCAYILELDGIYEKSEDEKLDKGRPAERRGRAYRGQSSMLLRQVDVVIALADPEREGSAGGTLETVRAALDFGLPVVFVDAKDTSVKLIRPQDDVQDAFAALHLSTADWQTALQNWITGVVANPDATRATTPGPSTSDFYGRRMLDEYLKCREDAQGRSDEGEGTAEKERRGGLMGWIVDPIISIYRGLRTRYDTWWLGESTSRWDNFQAPFSQPRPGDVAAPPTADKSTQTDANANLDAENTQEEAPLSDPLAVLKPRKCSSDLTGRYTGLYRGTYVYNYLLAFLAVGFAALSLLILGLCDVTKDDGGYHTWVVVILGTLGLNKLVCVGAIFWNTTDANDLKWNDKAVDYRFVAERLRAMLYLPHSGSFNPPAASPPQYASRILRQSAADWLVDAIVRSISPADSGVGMMQIVSADESGVGYPVNMIRLRPAESLQRIRDRWLEPQARYHEKNGRKMGRMKECFEAWGEALNVGVIVLVSADLVLLGLKLFHVLPKNLEAGLQPFTPMMIFFATIFPAAVASMNGVRFQSECARLAERSAVLRAMIQGHSYVVERTHAGPESWMERRRHQWGKMFPSKDKEEVIEVLDPAGRIQEAEDLLELITESTANPEHDLGAWAPRVLRFTESVSDMFVQEVAEWSVLYAKEVPEP